MIQIFKRISIVLCALLVLVLSFGFQISKMACDSSGAIYFGNKVPSCKIESDFNCFEESIEVSCCSAVKQESCCPSAAGDECLSITQDFQFQFETFKDIKILKFSYLGFVIYTNSIEFIYNQINNFNVSQYGIPPPNIYKPKLSNIQAFLL